MMYVYLAVAIGWLLTAAWGGYEKVRGDKIQANFDSYVAQQKVIVADTTVRWAEAIQKADEGAQARLVKAKEESDVLDKKLAAVQSNSVLVSRAFSDLLQYAGTQPTTADTGTHPGGKDAAAAVPTGTEAQAAVYDEAELGKFVVDARKAYDSASLAWKACVDEYEGVRLGTPQPKKGFL
jgi:hypothetical protein